MVAACTPEALQHAMHMAPLWGQIKFQKAPVAKKPEGERLFALLLRITTLQMKKT